VRVFDDLRASNPKDVGMSVPQFWDYRDRAGIFQDIAVIIPTPATLTGVDRPQPERDPQSSEPGGRDRKLSRE